MEREKCSFSSSHVASFYCVCTHPRLYFCLPCLGKHSESGGGHQIFPVSDQPPPQFSSEEDICSSCQKLPASILCCCSFPTVSLCEGCKLIHISKDNCAIHSLMPITLKEKLKSEQDVLMVKQRLMSLSVAETRAKLNEAEITKCEEMFRRRCEDVKRLVETYRDQQIEPLKKRKLSLETHLKEDLTHMRDHLLNATEPKGLEALIRTYMKTHNPESLDLFRYEQSDVKVDFSRVFGIQWESRMDTMGNLASDFSTIVENRALVEIYDRIAPLLEFQDEDKYVSSFTEELSLRMPEVAVSETSLHSHIEDARLHYFQEQFTCTQAKDQTIVELLPRLDSLSKKKKEEWVVTATTLFQQKATASNPGLVSKYREILLQSLEAAIDSRVKADTLKLENQKLEARLREFEREDVVPKKTRREKRGRPKKPKKSLAKRKTNGFQLFSKHCKVENKKQIEADHDGTQGAYLKTVSRMWKALSAEEQVMWKEKAQGPRRRSSSSSSSVSDSSLLSDSSSSQQDSSLSSDSSGSESSCAPNGKS